MVLVVRRGGPVAFSRKHAPMIRRLRRDEERLLTIQTITQCIVSGAALSPGHFIRQSDHKKKQTASVPNLKESVSSPVPQIYTRFYIFARVPRDESRRVSSNKLSFQLSLQPLGSSVQT